MCAFSPAHLSWSAPSPNRFIQRWLCIRALPIARAAAPSEPRPGTSRAAQGGLTVRFILEPSGAVKSASTEKPRAVDSAVQSCVRDALSGLRFPASHDGDIEVVSPLTF